MRENRSYGSEGGASSNGIVPTPIDRREDRQDASASALVKDRKQMGASPIQGFVIPCS